MRGRIPTAALVAAFAAVAIAAPAAQAAPEWHIGTSETSTVLDCSFSQQPGIQLSAALQADPQALPKVGDVFYARTVAGRIGEGCGIYMGAHVEVVPPPGVTLAISGANPVRCQWMDIPTGALTPADGCPQDIYEGVYGPAFDQLTPAGDTETHPWEIAYQKALAIEVPLVSSRPLHGTAPTCPRVSGMPPCLAASSGDTLQFTARMLDAWSSDWLSPYVPLFVEAAAADGGGAGGGGTTPGGTTPGGGRTPADGANGGHGRSTALASAPASLTLRRLLRGLPVVVNVARSRSRVVADLRAAGLRSSGSTVVARKVIRRAKVGRLRVRLKPARKGARALRRVRREAIKATLRVRVAPPRGRAQTYTKRIAVQR